MQKTQLATSSVRLRLYIVALIFTTVFLLAIPVSAQVFFLENPIANPRFAAADLDGDGIP